MWEEWGISRLHKREPPPLEGGALVSQGLPDGPVETEMLGGGQDARERPRRSVEAGSLNGRLLWRKHPHGRFGIPRSRDSAKLEAGYIPGREGSTNQDSLSKDQPAHQTQKGAEHGHCW